MSLLSVTTSLVGSFVPLFMGPKREERWEVKNGHTEGPDWVGRPSDSVFSDTWRRTFLVGSTWFCVVRFSLLPKSRLSRSWSWRGNPLTLILITRYYCRLYILFGNDLRSLIRSTNRKRYVIGEMNQIHSVYFSSPSSTVTLHLNLGPSVLSPEYTVRLPKRETGLPWTLSCFPTFLICQAHRKGFIVKH